jgi:hypothetical protein
MSAVGGPIQWVKQLFFGGTKKEKKRKLGILFTFWWMIWKERNSRIFEDKQRSVSQLIRLIQEEIVFNHSVLCPSNL